MVKPVDKQYSHKELEERILKYWKEKKCRELSNQKRKGFPKFYFVDGPPYTSGYVHPGTAWNKTVKDAKLRFMRMRGYDVFDRAGYDTHGLPIEKKVEKLLGIKRKSEIEERGIADFVLKCKEFAEKYIEIMSQEFERLGTWLDYKDPYITFKDDYIEAVWWTFKKMWENGLIELREGIVTWCPVCETSLANAEVEYKDKEDPSIYVKFPVKGKKEEYIIIWTTTPWTLPADLAVSVHPEVEYARAKVRKGEKEEIWILAKGLVEDVASRAGYKVIEILESFPGKELEGLEYVHPLLEEVPYHKKGPKNAYKVILGEHVEVERTGCVHTAPGHGEEDFEVCKRYGIPAFCPINDRGVFTEEGGKYKGIFVFDANEVIIEDLKKKGLLLVEEKVVHRYGHCWRCKTPIIYRATKQWFANVTKIREKMLKALEETEWTPKWAKDPRMKNWLENVRDWCLSRQRYWGTPIPVWTCEKGHFLVIGSLEELKELGAEIPEDLNLHRPWVDAIKLKCPICGKEMRRVSDVLDVWLDSAVASWAEIGFPKEKEAFEKLWPADWITEAHDQIRGWFYSQLAASVAVFGEAPYRRVLMHGWALDEEGRPMSKSLGNYISPMELIEKYGADSLRLYLLYNALWDDKKFSLDTLEDVHRQVKILWNVYSFCCLYMSLDKFDPERVKEAKLKLEDKWILSRLDWLISEVTRALEEDRFHEGVRALLNFIVEDVSHWYIRLIRDRVWVEEETPEKEAAYWTLYQVMVNYAKLLNPFAPFLSEEIYQNLCGKFPTVNMEDWPKELGFRDRELEKAMDLAKKVVEVISSLRQGAGIKLRWPLRRAAVSGEGAEILKKVKEIVLEAANLKELEIGLPEWGTPRKVARPKMQEIGPEFKQNAPKVMEYIKEHGEEIAKEISERGEAETPYGRISEKHVEIEEILPENVRREKVEGIEVYLDLKMDEELMREAYVREVIRRVQETRKRAGLNVSDYIVLGLQGDEKLLEAVKSLEDYFKYETRAKEIRYGKEVEGHSEDWEIEGMSLKVSLKRARKSSSSKIFFNSSGSLATLTPLRGRRSEKILHRKKGSFLSSRSQRKYSPERSVGKITTGCPPFMA